jgi:hypothetical protein
MSGTGTISNGFEYQESDNVMDFWKADQDVQRVSAFARH